MGNQRFLLEEGGFCEYLYEDYPGWESKAIGGVTGKVIRLVADPDGSHSGLPSYSDKADVYFKVGKDGKVMQAKAYKDRKQKLELDWAHQHKNKSDGKVFNKGVVHVHTYTVDSKGNFVRSSEARYMTNAEIAKYGELIHAYNPDVVLQP